MNLLKLTRIKYLLTFALLTSIFSCTYTKSFPPKLNDKGDAAISEIKSANSFEDIDLQEKTVSGSQKATILTVRLFNGKNLPVETDTVALKKLGKQIAEQIKPALADAKEVDSYVVLFCTRVIDGSTTHTKFTGYEYTSSEL